MSCYLRAPSPFTKYDAIESDWGWRMDVADNASLRQAYSFFRSPAEFTILQTILLGND